MTTPDRPDRPEQGPDRVDDPGPDRSGRPDDRERAERPDRRLALLVAAPFVVALLIASWLLWTREDPASQGGYCMNATVEIAGALLRADREGDVGRGPLPPADRLLAEVQRVDVPRLRVDTPPEVADDVELLAAERDPAAFARIAQDYLERCRAGG